MKREKVGFTVLFTILICLQVLCICYFANEKRGYFVDELWSYGLANSYYHPHVFSDGALDNCVSGEYFETYLEVASEHRFAYDSVIYNQINDVHPPLFYIALHTVCSLFPNTFSKWYGIGLNIIWFVIIEVLLYQLALKLFDKNKWQALIPVFAYGFSAGAISNVVYIRMYVLLTVWILVMLKLHSGGVLNGEIQRKDLIELMVISYLGFMTHYYFFIFAFFCSAFSIVFLFLDNRKKDIIKYVFAMYLSLGMVAFTFPSAFYRLVYGRGAEEFSAIPWYTKLLQHSIQYGRILNMECFSGYLHIILMIFLLSCGFVVYKIRGDIGKNQIEKYYKDNKSQIKLVCLLMGTSAGYYAIVITVAPFQVDRYIFCIYPIVILLAVYFAFAIMKKYKIPNMYCMILMISITALINVKGIKDGSIQYLYENQKDNLAIAEMHKGWDCLYITDHAYKLVGNALELQNMSKIYTIYSGDFGHIKDKFDSNKSQVVVYIDEELNQEEILRKLCEENGFSKYKKLYDSSCIAYEMMK